MWHRESARIPPLAVTLAAALTMRLLAQALPAPALALPARTVLALGVLLIGVVIAVAAVMALLGAGTTVDPLAPERTSSLVVDHVYSYSRNPIVLGMALVLLGWAVWLANATALAVLPAFVAFIDRFQIAPEEKVMAQRFGGRFRDYLARTRRWI